MIDMVSLTAPIFLLIALGFLAVRVGIVRPDFIQGLGFFVLHFALPALILHALFKQDLRETFNWNYIIVYAGGSLAVFIATLVVFQFVLRKKLSYAAIAALGSGASNSGFVGFPVASLAVGAHALTALPLSMLVENVLIIPLALGLAEIGSQHGRPLRQVARQTLRRLSRTPLILAIFLGLILSALRLHPPGPVSTAIGMVADASAPCALFVVGGTLAGLKDVSLAGDILWIALGKLLLHPLAVGTGFMLLGGVPAGLIAAGILLASAPMLTIYPILGQRFGLGGLCSAALVAATAASFVTITFAIGMVAGADPCGSAGGIPIDSRSNPAAGCIQ